MFVVLGNIRGAMVVSLRYGSRCAISIGYGVFVELVWDVVNMVEPQIYRTMAKSKQKEESAPIGQRLIFTNVNQVYQPLPRFESGCKNC